MNVVDAEYQFDRTKLSVYYTSSVRIDFRELVKNVFSTFQTRIWMKKSNREMSFEPKKFAVLALTTGVQFNQNNAEVFGPGAASNNGGGGGYGQGQGQQQMHHLGGGGGTYSPHTQQMRRSPPLGGLLGGAVGRAPLPYMA